MDITADPHLLYAHLPRAASSRSPRERRGGAAEGLLPDPGGGGRIPLRALSGEDKRPTGELLDRLIDDVAGGTFMTASVQDRLRDLQSHGRTTIQLSRREREVIKMIALGHSSKEIGRLLGISPRTVETYRNRLMGKLDLKTLAERTVHMGRQAVMFQTKFTQATEVLVRLAQVFRKAPMLVVTDSWFGNNGLLRPLRKALGERIHLLSRLRPNAALYAPPAPRHGPQRCGRPRKYGTHLGSATDLAGSMRKYASVYTLPLYGKPREVKACSRVCMIKTLKCPVRVVWIYRKAQ